MNYEHTTDIRYFSRLRKCSVRDDFNGRDFLSLYLTSFAPVTDPYWVVSRTVSLLTTPSP